jgi:hypothetical protein
LARSADIRSAAWPNTVTSARTCRQRACDITHAGPATFSWQRVARTVAQKLRGGASGKRAADSCRHVATTT